MLVTCISTPIPGKSLTLISSPPPRKRYCCELFSFDFLFLQKNVDFFLKKLFFIQNVAKINGTLENMIFNTKNTLFHTQKLFSVRGFSECKKMLT